MRKLRVLRAVALILVIGTATGARSAAQTEGWVRTLEIANLVPFAVTFRFENLSDARLRAVQGSVTLTDESGTMIDQIPIEPFDAPPRSALAVRAESRWEFQRPGIYLLEIGLDAGGDALLTGSLLFRILPIQLPDTPVPTWGEGLYTVMQQPSNWGLVRIHAPEAWGISHGDDRVVVAVIDSGIDTSIPQLAGALWTNPGEVAGNGLDDDGNGFIDDVHGWDFRDNDSGSLIGSTVHGHGTFVASIIAAQPGEYPIVGVAPGCRLMDVRFLDSANAFRATDWRAFARAIDYAVNNGADIINLSIYANGTPPTYFEQALTRASERGVLVVGIAGNLGQDEVMYPARYPSVLAVSAVTENDLLASFSNHGTNVALCAPGDAITSFTRGGRPSTQSGTSFAAPHVSGILALILSVAPGISPARAVEILEETADDLGARGVDESYGYGLADALKAVLQAGG